MISYRKQDHFLIMTNTEILSRFNINKLNPMQLAAISAIEKHSDVVLLSPTGSGKTLAFLLPLVNLLQADKKGIQTLILVPSRELAQQIEQVFKQMSTGFKINACYGGHETRIERNNLLEAPAVLVGTPGRISHHLLKENLSLKDTNYLILDEFDKSLDAGFHGEMDFIIKTMKSIKKRVLTSATSLKDIPGFVGIKKKTELDFTGKHEELKPSIQLRLIRTSKVDKIESLFLLIGKLGNQPKIVFCNHREMVDTISDELHKLKIAHGLYHGGMEQIDREKTLIKLRNGSIELLIATDLASRGLDIPEIGAVIHFQMPHTEQDMIHRNGRTGRMNAKGTAYLLVDRSETVPEYLTTPPIEDVLPSKLKLPEACPWKTLYLSAGKKDKINKMDIVGMLLQKGKLKKEELGKIEVLDHSSYVAIAIDKIEETLDRVRDEKIKNKKVKMEIST